MKRTGNAIAVVLLVMFIGVALAVAQHNHAAMSQAPAGQGSGEEMMKSCQKHGSETMAALDQLEKTIAAGRESNDPAKMKAALDEAQKQVATAKHHVGMCPMMSGGKMQHGGMDMKGMSDQKPKQ